jgi:hypothetical protein
VFLFHTWEVLDSYLGLDAKYLESYSTFPSVRPTDSRVVPQIWPRMLPSTHLGFYCPPVVLSGATEVLNKL